MIAKSVASLTCPLAGEMTGSLVEASAGGFIGTVEMLVSINVR